MAPVRRVSHTGGHLERVCIVELGERNCLKHLGLGSRQCVIKLLNGKDKWNKGWMIGQRKQSPDFHNHWAAEGASSDIQVHETSRVPAILVQLVQSMAPADPIWDCKCLAHLQRQGSSSSPCTPSGSPLKAEYPEPGHFQWGKACWSLESMKTAFWNG